MADELTPRRTLAARQAAVIARERAEFPDGPEAYDHRQAQLEMEYCHGTKELGGNESCESVGR